MVQLHYNYKCVPQILLTFADFYLYNEKRMNVVFQSPQFVKSAVNYFSIL